MPQTLVHAKWSALVQNHVSALYGHGFTACININLQASKKRGLLSTLLQQNNKKNRIDVTLCKEEKEADKGKQEIT